MTVFVYKELTKNQKSNTDVKTFVMLLKNIVQTIRPHDNVANLVGLRINLGARKFFHHVLWNNCECKLRINLDLLHAILGFFFAFFIED